MAKISLGTAVEYRDSQGFAKLGFVTGTRQSVNKDSELRPDKGSAHLVIFSPTGKTYSRQNIAEGEGPQTFTRV